VLSILTQVNPVPTLPSYFFKVHVSSSEWLGLPSSLLPGEIPMFLCEFFFCAHVYYTGPLINQNSHLSYSNLIRNYYWDDEIGEVCGISGRYEICREFLWHELQGNKLFGWPNCRWWDNFKMGLKENRSSKLAQPVTCIVFTCKVSGFNLDWDTLYLQVVVVSRHLSRHMLGQYLKLDCHNFITYPFQVIIHYNVFIRHYRLLIYWVSLNKQ